MGSMSDLDLSIRELIFEGTLEENIKENVGTKINIRGYDYIVTEKDITDYYNQETRTNLYMDMVDKDEGIRLSFLWMYEEQTQVCLMKWEVFMLMI